MLHETEKAKVYPNGKKYWICIKCQKENLSSKTMCELCTETATSKWLCKKCNVVSSGFKCAKCLDIADTIIIR